MSDDKKCITDTTFQKKLNQIKAFKQKVIKIKSEDFKSEAKPILYTGDKAKIKMDSIFSRNSPENSARKSKLKLITRNDVYIYLNEQKKNKNIKLQPIKKTIEENKSESLNNIKKLNDIKTNRTIQIKAIKLVDKDEKMIKVISHKNFLENNKISEEK